MKQFAVTGEGEEIFMLTYQQGLKGLTCSWGRSVHSRESCVSSQLSVATTSCPTSLVLGVLAGHHEGLEGGVASSQEAAALRRTEWMDAMYRRMMEGSCHERESQFGFEPTY